MSVYNILNLIATLFSLTIFDDGIIIIQTKKMFLARPRGLPSFKIKNKEFFYAKNQKGI